ncbi:MAG: ribonuclease Y [Thiovulaceae bacterium]|nr:ribonuclease Y [Sulfurimonadaceae bacterium]
MHIEQAKAKAAAIEKEAELLLERANLKAKDIELQSQREYNEAGERALKELCGREDLLAERVQEFEADARNRRSALERERGVATSLQLSLERQQKGLVKLEDEYKQRLEQAIQAVENAAGMTKEEAKELLLKQVEERSRADIAHIVRRYENEAKQEGERKANYILAQATSRYAGEFAHERLINTVQLTDDELKGRIIGREGRNIKTLEMLLGVDIIIDDTPNAIIVSSFNMYRRAIATRTLELLIEDGRIQPARIEEIYNKVCEQFDEKILEDGENIVFELGISGLHPELIKLVGRLRYRASYGQNALGHTLEVANLAGIMAAEMGGDAKLAKRAGLLHDIGKALTHDFEGSHVDLGAEVCRRYSEDPVVINAIYAHHGLQEIKSIECGAVCAADALSAARPGARREVLESFLKRVGAIEDIASAKRGVKQAYAINAGREVRVMVSAELISDDEASLLAREIAEEIESQVSYPGDIKVNVIRESRAVEYAK